LVPLAGIGIIDFTVWKLADIWFSGGDYALAGCNIAENSWEHILLCGIVFFHFYYLIIYYFEN
jgi:hypothetical protein